MLRKLVGAAVVLAFLAGPVGAQEKKPPSKPPVGPASGQFFTQGTIKKVDADKGILVLETQQKGEKKEVKVEVTDSTRFETFTRGGRKEYKGKEGLMAKEFKEGTHVQYFKSPDGKSVRIVAFGGFSGRPETPLGRPTTGKIKTIDVDNGILILETGNKDKPTELKIKVNSETHFLALTREGRKEYKGKAGLKAKEFKEGTHVQYMKSPDGKHWAIMAFGGVSEHPLNPYTVPMPGKIKKIDAKKGILTLTVPQGEEGKDVDLKITDETKFLIRTKDEKKELTAKEAEKSDEFKPGTRVTVMKDREGNAKMVTIGGPSAIKPKLGDK